MWVAQQLLRCQSGCVSQTIFGQLLHHLVQQLVHWLFGFQNLLDHTVGYIEYKLDQPPLVVGSLVQLVQPWRCSTMWVQPTNWYFTQWCYEPMAGTHHVNHAMPNTKSNPHEMPYVASNTHGNVMPKKAGFKLFFPASKYCSSVVYDCLAALLYGFLDSKDSCLLWSRTKNGSSCSLANGITTSLKVGFWPCIKYWMLVPFNGTSTTSELGSCLVTLLFFLGLSLASSSWSSWSDMVPSLDHASFLLVMKSWNPGWLEKDAFTLGFPKKSWLSW